MRVPTLPVYSIATSSYFWTSCVLSPFWMIILVIFMVSEQLLL